MEILGDLVLKANGHTVRIELDADGNLKINGNVYATGGVAAGGPSNNNNNNG